MALTSSTRRIALVVTPGFACVHKTLYTLGSTLTRYAARQAALIALTCATDHSQRVCKRTLMTLDRLRQYGGRWPVWRRRRDALASAEEIMCLCNTCPLRRLVRIDPVTELHDVVLVTATRLAVPASVRCECEWECASVSVSVSV